MQNLTTYSQALCLLLGVYTGTQNQLQNLSVLTAYLSTKRYIFMQRIDNIDLLSTTSTRIHTNTHTRIEINTCNCVFSYQLVLRSGNLQQQ